MNIQLPLTSDEFFSRLKALGLIPESSFVTSVEINAYPGDFVTLRVTLVPEVDLSEALR